jgi:putative transposase
MNTKTTVRKINLKHFPYAYSQVRQETARFWNDLMKLHKYIRKRHWRWPNASQLEKHYKKKSYGIHSQTKQALIAKFLSNVSTTRTNRKNGRNARYPYKLKKNFNPIWKKTGIKRQGRLVKLSLGSGNGSIEFTLPKSIVALLENESHSLQQVELGYFEINLTLRETLEDVPSHDFQGHAAIDFGLIHTAVIADGKTALSIVGRALRSVNQGYNKQLARLVKKQSKCTKYSRRWRKLQKRKKLLAKHKKNYLRNFYHHVSNLLVDYCVENEIKTVFYGNIADISRNKKKKMSKRNNQEMSHLSLSTLIRYCREKLNEQHIEFEEVGEHYTSQTCPSCGHRHKVKGRVFHCKQCNFKAFRDEVGAYNILNKSLNNNVIKIGKYKPTGEIKYLRPIVIGNRSRGDDTPLQLAA